MDRETVEDIKRHFGVVAEGLEDEIRAVAKGQQLLAEELRGFRGDHEVFRADMGRFRADVAREFDETRAMIRLSYGELDRRLSDLEGEVSDLRTRLARVEARMAS